MVTVIQFFRTYDDWKYCITVLCGIPLDLAYVEQRLAALRDPSGHLEKPVVLRPDG